MAYPVLEDYNGFARASSNEAPITAPDGITAGDLLIAVGITDYDGATAEVLSIDTDTYSGWIKLTEVGNATPAVHVAVFYKIATGSEGDILIDRPLANNMIAWYLRFSAADTADPIDTYGQNISADNTSFVLNNLTTTVDECRCYYFFGFNEAAGAGGITISGTGWTETQEIPSFSTLNAAFGTKQQATAGSVGSPTVGTTNSDGAAWVVLAVSSVQESATLGAFSGVTESGISALMGISLANINSINDLSL